MPDWISLKAELAKPAYAGLTDQQVASLPGPASQGFPTPSGLWGLCVAVVIFDALTAGNLLVYGTLTTPRNVTDSGTPISFPVSALSDQIDS